MDYYCCAVPKVEALTLWSGAKTGHEQKTAESEEKREAAYFTDGTHGDSPQVMRRIGIFRAKPRISQPTQPALSAPRAHARMKKLQFPAVRGSIDTTTPEGYSFER